MLLGAGAKRAQWKDKEKAKEHDQGEEGKDEQTRARIDAKRVCRNGVGTRTDQPCASRARTPRSKGKMAVEMGEAQEAKLAASAAEASQHDAAHLDGNGSRVVQRRSEGDDEHAAGRQGDKGHDADMVGYLVYEVGCAELGQKRGQDIGEQHDTLGNVGTDEIEGSREDDYVEDVVDEACSV